MTVDITHCIENSLLLCLPKQRWCPNWNLKYCHLLCLPEETLNPFQIGNFSLFVGDFFMCFVLIRVQHCLCRSEAHKSKSPDRTL